MKKTRKKLILICLCASLASLSIILGKYLAINFGDTIRLSFENLPILLAGLYFGPLAGALVGVVADLVGCLLVGYSINPIITLGAASIGLLAGFAGNIKSKLKIPLCLLLSHTVGSILIKTVGLWVYFQAPFLATLGTRTLTYLVIALAEGAILYALSKSRALRNATDRIKNQEESL